LKKGLYTPARFHAEYGRGLTTLFWSPGLPVDFAAREKPEQPSSDRHSWIARPGSAGNGSEGRFHIKLKGIMYAAIEQQ